MSGRIQFNSILWKNFLSYGNNESEIDLTENQLTAITGKNGAGKTSFLAAIFFALYGKPLTKINKSSLVNNKNKKDCFVRLKFQIGSDNYIIERGIKPDILNLFKNDKLIDMNGDSRDFQKNFEENILRIDSKSFVRLICLGYDYIRFFELSSPDRRQFIESILDLEILSSMASKIKEYNKSDSDDMIQLNVLISTKKSNLKIYEQQLESYKSDNDKIINELNSQIDKLTLENSEINLDIITNENKKQKLISERKEIELLINSNNETISTYKSLINVGNSKLDNFKKEIDFFTHNLSCPTCSRDIDKEFATDKIEKLNLNIIKINNKIIEAKNIVNSTDEILKINNNALNDYNNKIRLIDNKILEINVKLNSNKNTIEINKNKIKSMSENKQISDTINKIALLNNEIDNHSKKTNILIENIENYKKCLTILSETGVKKSIIDNYISIINSLVNKYLDKFSFPYSFNMDNEFNEILMHDFREPVTYYSLSAGQRQRLDLSMLLTWRAIAKLRNSISTNLLLADEILDTNLDINGTKDLINILKDEDDYNIFIISHKDVIDDVDNIIKINKEKFGFSIIEKDLK